MGLKNTVSFVLLLAVMTSLARAEKHVVVWQTSTDFDSWALAKTFKVGDQLVFKYSAGLHSVVELAGKKAYENCDTSTAVDSKTSGSDLVRLSKAGTRYFTCGTLGHCGQGMKLAVRVVAGNAPSSPSSPAATSTAEYSSTSRSYGTDFALLTLLLAAIFLVRS